ncbi:hypothetical protein GUJ93_ZPchr0007g3543 [Zizania palustris]|uniref:NAC domain-containing protein n=1 Tax=Zizania palustris TaxID=103762 RepID=A0A8J5SR36_ZIZPA|nr:hypothetical protein GUJ93_ZPchr0007g3543 [Zizania palustris]
MADDVDGRMAPGYRFYPTEEELICFYLRNKLDSRRDDIERVIPVFDVYSVDPCRLSGTTTPTTRPAASSGSSRALRTSLLYPHLLRAEIHERLCGGVGVGGEGEQPWFYFCPRQEREARGGRPSRTTPSGYWKAAGTPGVVYSAADRRPIGMKKTMVFYRGRVPSGSKTKWKMNEYRAFHYVHASTAATVVAGSAAPLSLPPQVRSEFSLCRLYTKQTGCSRQFDRRPLASGGENPVVGTSSTAPAATASPEEDNGSYDSMIKQQAQQPAELMMDRGGAVGLEYWGDDDVATMTTALLYWPED